MTTITTSDAANCGVTKSGIQSGMGGQVYRVGAAPATGARRTRGGRRWQAAGLPTRPAARGIAPFATPCHPARPPRGKA